METWNTWIWKFIPSRSTGELSECQARTFPGWFFRAKHLSSLLKLANLAYEKSQNTTDTELIDATRDLAERLQKLVAHYESTLNKHNIPLPYSTVPSKAWRIITDILL